MDDKKLKELLRRIEIPEAGDEAKNAAISNALHEFEKSQKNNQGSIQPERLTDKSPKFGYFINLIKGNFMNTQLTKGLTFASVLAVTVFAAVNVYEMKKSSVVGDYYDPQKTVIKTELAATSSLSTPASAPELKAQMQSVADEKRKDADASMPVDAAMPVAPEAITSQIVYVAKEEALRDKSSKKLDLRQEMAAGSASRYMESNVAAPSTLGKSAAPGMYDITFQQRAYCCPVPAPQPEISGDKFKHFESNKFISSADNSVSTFSIDVDTTSYSYVRKALMNGSIPSKDAIRVEEMVNYFDYDYPLPESKEVPFRSSIAIYPTPWNKNSKLIHIGIKRYDIDKSVKPRSNLVFLIDTSGSMAAQDKLPLLKQSFAMLIDNLSPEDTVGIVTYAGSAGVALEPTKIADKAKIFSVLENLYSGGSTAGEAGIINAYDLVQKNFNKESVNRVILATDGDFNIGISDPEQLKKLVEEKRNSGIYLSVLGFGQGNYNDEIMQSLAQNGNGNAAYIDSLNEARKVLVNEASSTIFPIAKDVKLQVEFNPSKVAEYKLIGYETRALNREDFNNDKVDAGDIGSGHAVTAIYEIITTDSNYRNVDPLRYVKEDVVKPVSNNNGSDEYAFLKIRYKLPDASESKLITQPITKEFEKDNISGENSEVKFATSVAAFSLILRNDIATSDISYEQIAKLAQEGKGGDEFGYRQEFINMVKNAEYMKRGQQPQQIIEQPYQILPVPSYAPGVAPQPYYK